ncbi:MarR family transcriptional regulator [Bacillus pseudomycoides]|uniref:MarR family winged helix-turn-helix transcriptional regulator n=1 Tax=Bacillus pseudomycoides TaxID=64104 RepID=UPI000BEC92A8|nr:MarR family transcriptional regulator [Bacillus pseudomycoides]PED68791.1 MarR family transcriptional regulator [Bacillus pseudomycoides]PEI34048.1 MarR family transcriptional regulator [Bacillus pseudomycoides]PEJ71726.1 MarR family transcriptional regulator [Bacillus pseudomycoides]PEM09782.1 MarR family transcriptional regulator [Bacillus pseudomycoides]PEO98869.1 MarR family transcriptional regulator [Bacillus pseudomycoides]
MEYSKALRELYLMQQTYATLFSTTNKLQIQGDNYLEKLTSRQYMIMIAITHLPEDETTLANIAKKLKTSKQSAQKLIVNLESKGYLITKPSKRDKRAINVEITELGKKIMMECGERAVCLMADIFNEFTTEELEVLWSLLKRLYGTNNEEEEVGFEEDVNYKFEKLEGFQEAQSRALDSFVLRRKAFLNDEDKYI